MYKFQDWQQHWQAADTPWTGAQVNDVLYQTLYACSQISAYKQMHTPSFLLQVILQLYASSTTPDSQSLQ